MSNMKKFNTIDYKGKYYIIQDKEIQDDMDIIIGEISKDSALDPDYILNHKENCCYYGIPCYSGKDEEMLKAYKQI